MTVNPALESLKRKAPWLLFLIVVLVAVLVITLDTLEDVLIEGGTFTDTPLALVFNFVVSLVENVTAAISSLGYAGIFMLMLLEASSLPIPSEVVLPFAGYLVSQGLLDFWLTLLVATVAGVSGSLIDYFIGLKGIKILTERKVMGRSLLSETRLKTADEWFNRFGVFAVFLSRLIPGFRTLVSFPAGAVRMRMSKFLVWTTLGCVVWNTLLIYIGMYLGANWREVASAAHYIIIASAIAIIIAIAAFLIRRTRNNSKTKRKFNS